MRSFKITQSITDRQDTSLGLYFKDVSKQPMITAEEEIELTKEIKNGNNAAMDKLVRANLRFVISVAKQYQNKGLTLVDLIQEGNLGLIEAAKKFDETRGFKFISYAVWWIRQSIMKAISDQCRTVRIPMNKVVYISKINKSSEKFEQIYGRKPSTSELKEFANIDEDKIIDTTTINSRSVSLDSPFNDEDVGSLLDIIPNSNVEELDKDLNVSDTTSIIEEILSKIPYRNSDVIRMSYGIGMSPMPNEEIAARFGVGSERIRQIQHSTLEYLRKNYYKELSELF